MEYLLLYVFVKFEDVFIYNFCFGMIDTVWLLLLQAFGCLNFVRCCNECGKVLQDLSLTAEPTFVKDASGQVIMDRKDLRLFELNP